MVLPRRDIALGGILVSLFSVFSPKETTFVTPVCFPGQRSPSKFASSLKGKEKIFPLKDGPYRELGQQK